MQRRLDETDVLVIDEISMVENHFFERLNAFMKEARGRDLAFGGVQLIVTGDVSNNPGASKSLVLIFLVLSITAGLAVQVLHGVWKRTQAEPGEDYIYVSYAWHIL